MSAGRFRASARLTGVIILSLQFLSGIYCKLYLEGCESIDFATYWCANRQVTLSAEENFITISCHSANVTCSDLPHMDRQITRAVVGNCSSSILTCMRDPLGLDLSIIRHVLLQHIRDPLKVEHVRDLKYLTNLKLLLDEDTPMPVAAINSLKYLTFLEVNGGKLQLLSDMFNSTSLQKLHLKKSNMNSEGTGFFNGLPNLKVLLLDVVKIENINRSFFKGLNSLEILSLCDNHLKHLEARVFNSTPKLKQLKIINNPLEALPEQVFDGLTCLQELYIKCSIKKSVNETKFNFGKFIISQLPALKIIILNHCVLQKSAIQNTSDVTMTAEYGNHLNDFRPIIFTNLDSLKRLLLDGNYIYELSDAMFTNMTALNVLSIADNRIKELPKNIFKSITGLETLILTSNNIKVLPDGIFSNLSSLHTLDLAYNHIEELTLDIFVGLDNLAELYLDSNNIMMIHVYSDDDRSILSPFRHLPNLQKLYLCDNNIKTLYESLASDMPKLLLLNLCQNQLTDFWDFHQIYTRKHIYINLILNNITQIRLNPRVHIKDQHYNESQTNTGIIYLEQNPIFCDCVNYGLFLRTKGIRERSEPRFSLEHTRCSGPPNLKGKFFTELSPTDLTCDLPYDCPTNCICFFRPATEEVVVNCEKLHTELLLKRLWPYPLHLYPDYRYQLNLKTQPNSLVNFQVYTLNLSSTNLQNLTFQPNNYLKILDISNNSLSTLPDTFLKTNITLYVANNPLECNCALVKELKEHRVADYKLVRCADGKELSEINVSRLCGWRTILAGYICMGIIAGIFLTKLGFSVYRDMKRTRTSIARILFRRGSEYSIQMERRMDMVKEYDLFISFAHEDTQFVREDLVPTLENKFDLKVCIHDRDWVAGELIDDQIIQSVESARRTIIILTEAFILSEWSYLEFRTAHNVSIREGRPRVIIILLNEEIVNDSRLSKAIKSYTLINTYLVWGDPDFWNKLKRILPKRSRR